MSQRGETRVLAQASHTCMHKLTLFRQGRRAEALSVCLHAYIKLFDRGCWPVLFLVFQLLDSPAFTALTLVLVGTVRASDPARSSQLWKPWGKATPVCSAARRVWQGNSAARL